VFAEKFFDMTQPQCTAALEIYKKFIARMDRVRAFLRIAEVSRQIQLSFCFGFFYAQQHICYSAYMLSPVRLSVRPSVTQVGDRKTVEISIMKFSPYVSPIPLIFVG